MVDQLGQIEMLTVADVLALFESPNPLAMAEAEIQALTRAFGGVQWATETAWVSVSRLFSDPDRPFADRRFSG